MCSVAFMINVEYSGLSHIASQSSGPSSFIKPEGKTSLKDFCIVMLFSMFVLFFQLLCI